jgi:hypothetical protein
LSGARQISTDLLAQYKVSLLYANTPRGERMLEMMRDDEAYPLPNCFLCNVDFAHGNRIAAFVIIHANIKRPTRECGFAVCSRCADRPGLDRRIELIEHERQLYHHIYEFQQAPGWA